MALTDPQKMRCWDITIHCTSLEDPLPLLIARCKSWIYQKQEEEENGFFWAMRIVLKKKMTREQVQNLFGCWNVMFAYDSWSSDETIVEGPWTGSQ